ncbi:MAG: hypothetical protein WC722_15320 [Rhodospirillales bacterium]|jgi:hypothetical protein
MFFVKANSTLIVRQGIPLNDYSEELAKIIDRSPDANRFVKKATDDYLLGRLGVLHGLESGLDKAYEGVEKLLKAFILFTDQSLGGKSQGKKWGHNVLGFLEQAKSNGLKLDPECERFVSTLKFHYGIRYPDTTGHSYSFGSDATHKIDALFFQLWDNFEPIYGDFLCMHGPYEPIFGSQTPMNFFVQHMLQALAPDNRELEKRNDYLVSEFKKWEERLSANKHD